MIIPNKALKDLINAAPTRKSFCETFEIDEATLYKYLAGEQTCSSKFIHSVIQRTGMDFEKAFDVKDK